MSDSKIDAWLEGEPPTPPKTILRERLYKNNPSHNHPKRNESDRVKAINKLLEKQVLIKPKCNEILV